MSHARVSKRSSRRVGKCIGGGGEGGHVTAAWVLGAKLAGTLTGKLAGNVEGRGGAAVEGGGAGALVLEVRPALLVDDERIRPNVEV